MPTISDLLIAIDAVKRNPGSYLGGWLGSIPTMLAAGADARYPGTNATERMRGLLAGTPLEQTGTLANELGGLLGVPGAGTVAGAVAKGVGLSKIGLLPVMAGTFAGVGAKTADMAALSTAKHMANLAEDPVKIWQTTGWTNQFPDKKWRFEIPDAGATVKDMQVPNFSDIAARKATGKSLIDIPIEQRGPFTKDTIRLIEEWYLNPEKSVAPLPDYVSHPELMKAHPDIANMKVGQQMGGGVLGSFDNASDTIRYGGGTLLNTGKDSAKSTVLHELQHAVQQREGFARGGNPENAMHPSVDKINEELSHLAKTMDGMRSTRYATDPVYKWPSDKAWQSQFDELKRAYDQLLEQRSQLPTGYEAYKRLAGEAEARLTQSRMNLTPSERMQRPPWMEFDVPPEQQIVRGLLGQ